MSCGAQCPCQLSCLVDTQGSKRDPISSEKAWLDYAVRYLSRTAICKGKGQEAVWSSKCKPSWWDSVVGLPWKNPTANPKDTKEVLMKKYEGLKDRLLAEGRFPNELREEATLWEEGKYKELFLLTSLFSLKDKVTGLHAAVREVGSKADEMGADVNQTLIRDIQSCLGATLKEVQNLNTGSNTQKGFKRSNPDAGKENVENVCAKKCKVMNPVKNGRQLSVSLPSSKVVSILPKQNISEVILSKVETSGSKTDQSRDIVLQLQKVLKKRKELSVAMDASNHCITDKTRQSTVCRKSLSSGSPSILPSTQILNSSLPSPLPSSSASENLPSPFSTTFVTPVPELSEESHMKNSHLSTIPNHNIESNSQCAEFQMAQETPPVDSEVCSEYNNHSDHTNDSFLGISSLVDIPPSGGDSGSISIDSTEIDFLLSPVDHDFLREEVSNTGVMKIIEQLGGNEINFEEITCSSEIGSYDTGTGSRIKDGRTSSNCSTQGSHVSDSPSLDSGCLSDSSLVDSILSPEEQNQLLLDDDIDGFLSNFQNSNSEAVNPMDALMADFDLGSFVDDLEMQTE